jgi:hypothetical protein
MVKVLKRVAYCDVCVTFKEWLSDNGHRFNRKYKIRHYDKGESIGIYFEDVTPELHCYVYEGNVGTSVHFKRRFWDFLEDFDYVMRRGRNRKYYATCAGNESIMIRLRRCYSSILLRISWSG